MKFLPRGTRVVVYTPEYMGGFGIHTFTEFNVCFSEDILKKYYNGFDGIPEIRNYLGVNEHESILRLTFDSKYNLMNYERNYDLSHINYMWVATKSLL